MSIDLDKAAAIENDETMIINSDHSIITTPVVESPDGGIAKTAKEQESSQHKTESDETSPSDTSEAVVGEKNKRYRPKARSDSNRSEKYAKFFVFSFMFDWLIPSHSNFSVLSARVSQYCTV